MDNPFVSNETSSWLLYILTDSALPTGGFVASSGLEAMHQAGLLNGDNLADFVISANMSYASNSTCFVRAGYEAMDDKDPLSRLKECDSVCEAVMVANAVGRRASLAQGVAMIILYLKCFAETTNDLDINVMKRWKALIRAEEVEGHFPVCFGLVCRYLKVDLENTLHLWLYLFTRTLYSSAVRMNIVGPYEAQRLLLRSRQPIERIIKETKDISMDDCCQTNPLLDVCQGMHDRLYTRLFNS
ncbi:urease accessory protein [Lichtheimia corymbifera JMRC:FSU:9682]|uniref:Urease accessory protein n=1 Tax=Lichtheimia corymbifera JMRC:FSU:9682 TaxID=1263082 RepID=A0A068S0V1_9FUNG|nr:urease accessory protein [Lichtheimia corymbifera JMRC:FSU:9682]